MSLQFKDIPGDPEMKMLNCALLLETAQAQFYDEILLRLTGGGVSESKTEIPGLELPPRSMDVLFLQTIRQIEHDHRDMLSTTLRTDAMKIAPFRFGLEGMSRQEALSALFTLEQTTARGYLGLLGKLPSKQNVTLLAALQGTESRHVAIVSSVMESLFQIKQSPFAAGPTGREPALNPDAVFGFLDRYMAA